ncbi:MAG: alpha/beta fold hydrolase [Ferrovibrio sp.]|uniref:alpha/beta hydrolase family protein n=1 Tax=Ferrovibrio sp. TaxID=1917215 RepID=UPI0026035DBB|nr:alpha/beta fold hydrolase [Ferrovibrio sp.]MCW0235170.1 alpha/beta fold hydrolase [Ferrovibrio sp.]
MRRWLASLLFVFGLCASAQAAEGVVSQQVSFTSNDGSVLAGTLTLPAGTTERVPALVLLQGSGPTNRDGNQPPVLRTDLLRQIAEGLARKGIATLRYDKRGMHANAAGRPADPADYAAYFNWGHFVDDAYAAYAFLRAQPGVDLHKTGLLGHSEGGTIALDLSSRLQAGEKPAFLILMATAGRRLDVIVREQLDRQLGSLKPGQKRAFLAENDRISQAIRDTGTVPAKLPQALNGLYPSYSGPFWQAQLKLDPAELAQRYPGPVLLVQGDADIQVSAQRDAVALDRALQKRSEDDHTLILLPRTSHNLKPLQDDKDSGIEGEIDPTLTDRIATWLLSKLAP